MSKRRAAILGCGGRGIHQAIAYAHVKGGELIACCDVDQARRDAFGDRFGIDARYHDLGRMLAEAKPDVLHIVTLPSARWSIVEVALENPPRAIVVEKPLAQVPSEGYRILDACARAGVPLYVNHQTRHHRSWSQLRDLVEREAVGPIRHVRASCRGTLFEQGTHFFDLLYYLFGDRHALTNPTATSLDAAPYPWLAAHASGAAAYRNTHSSPGYVCGTLAPAADWHITFACGREAPIWPGEDNLWFHFGVEIVGRDGVMGCSLNRGWWMRTAWRDDGEDFAYMDEDPHAQACLVDSVFDTLDDPDRNPNNAAHSRVSWDLVVSVVGSAWRRARVTPGTPVGDDEATALRAAIEAADASI
jgi:predicted dehydrogenase